MRRALNQFQPHYLHQFQSHYLPPCKCFQPSKGPFRLSPPQTCRLRPPRPSISTVQTQKPLNKRARRAQLLSRRRMLLSLEISRRGDTREGLFIISAHIGHLQRPRSLAGAPAVLRVLLTFTLDWSTICGPDAAFYFFPSPPPPTRGLF